MINPTVLVVLAFTPLVVFSLLMVVTKIPILKVALVALAITIISALGVWRIQPDAIAMSAAKGTLVAFDILLIVFGAIFFLEVLKKRTILESISYYLSSISKDYRVKVIILAWLFEGFLEGTAGFGSNIAVVAPLLVTLGLTPLKALIIAVLGNSTSVAFGAIGTPTRVGFASLNLPLVGEYGALFSFVGVLVPVAMLWLVTSGRCDRTTEFVEGLPFALTAGLSFVFFSFITSFAGDEFPSVLGSLLAILVCMALLKIQVIRPRTIRGIEGSANSVSKNTPGYSIIPYGVLILALIVGKLALGSLGIPIPLVNHKIALFNPGFAFFIAADIFILISKIKVSEAFATLKDAFKRSLNPFLVTAAMGVLVQVMEATGKNPYHFVSMIGLIAGVFTTNLLAFWTPFIGAFGAFTTGSATMSNILFGKSLALSASSLGFGVDKILGLLLAGAAAGNIIAISDVSAGVAVVTIPNGVRRVIRGTLAVCLLYLVLLAVVGLFVVSTPSN